MSIQIYHFTNFSISIDVKILKTEIIDGNLHILRLQPSGKNPMDWKSFVNGLRGAEIKIGE